MAASVLPSASAALDRAGAPVSLVARVLSIGRPEGVEGRPGYRIACADLLEDEFLLAPVTARALCDVARAALRRGHRVLCHGSFEEVAIGKGRTGYLFFLAGIERLREALPLLAPAGTEAGDTDALLARLGADGIEPFLLDAAHRVLGVRERSLSARFRLAERAVLYAALSAGQVEGRTNPRPSLLLCSRPGTGKKVLCDQALLFQPAGRIVQSGMATPAGLSASVSQSAERGLHAAPGLLALSDQGVAVLEDTHRFDSGQLHSIRDVLASVMEDGQLIACKAAHGDFQAHTALQMSVNRKSDLRGGKPASPAARLSDLGLTLDIASRFDFWIDLDVGDNAVAASQEMLTWNPPMNEEEKAALSRQVKLLVARLRDRFPQVDLSPAGVQEEMQRRLEEVAIVLHEAASHGAGEDLGVDAMLRRLANTLRKAVGAEARLHGRGTAGAADVTRAFEVVQLKVRALCGLHREGGEPLLSWERLVLEARARKEAREQLIEEHFLGREATAQEIAAALGLSLVQVERYLLARGRLLDDGRYRVLGAAVAAPAGERPAGSPQPAADAKTAERMFRHTPTLCAVLKKEAAKTARGREGWELCARAGQAIEMISSGWHPGLRDGLPGNLPLVYGVMAPDPRDLRTLVQAIYRKLDEREAGAPPLHLALFVDDVEGTVAALERLGARPGGRYDAGPVLQPRPPRAATPRPPSAHDPLPGLLPDLFTDGFMARARAGEHSGRYRPSRRRIC